MADNDEVFRIINQVENEQAVTALRAQYEQAEAALGQMIATQRTAGGTGLTSAIESQATSVARLRGELSSAESGLTKMGGSGRNSGMALMEISRAAEDAQYGLNGVLNNLPGLVMSLGGSAGLVGVVSLVAVGAYQLYKHWDDLAGIWGGGHTKTQAEEMAELAKKTSLTADEAERLGRATALTSKVKELQTGRTKEQKKTDEAVTEAIIEAGTPDVVRGMLAARPDLVDAQGDVPEALRKARNADLAHLNASIAHGAGSMTISDAKLEELRGTSIAAQEELRKAREATATRIVATGGITQFYPGGPDQLIGAVAAAPGKFGPKSDELLTGLREATPEGRAAKLKAEGESDTVWEESQQSIAEMKKYQKKRRDDEAKALEAEAKQNEKAWMEDVQTASRTKSFMGKVPGYLTPAEKEAKRLYDEREQGKAQEKVESDREKQEKAYRTDMGQAPGLDEFIRDQMVMGASNQQLAGLLAGLGYNEEQTTDLLGKGAKAGYDKLLKDTEETKSSQTLQGGAALRDAIQAGVTNQDVGKQQLDRLNAAVGYLQRIADQRPDMTARAS